MGKYWSTLSIEYHIDRHRRPRIELNGQAVPGVRELRVEWAVDNIALATLVIGVDDLQIDTETLIQLRALMEARQPETRPTVVAPLPGDEE